MGVGEMIPDLYWYGGRRRGPIHSPQLGYINSAPVSSQVHTDVVTPS